jgi:membrane-bound hydrogenase subunit beta
MAEVKTLGPKEIESYFIDKFKTQIKHSTIKLRKVGSKKNESVNIWMKVDKAAFKDVIKHLCDLQFPHLAIISGNDLGKSIELIYHFSLYFGEHLNEISLNISVDLPKSKPEIETICDYIPGALITEREKQDFLGVKIKGIPDDRRLFIPDDFPKDVYPWRRDETGPEKFYKNLHEVKK